MDPFVQSGRAIQHVKEKIFTVEGGVRRGIPKVLVVLTDGRSQDDVNKVSKEMQMEGQNSLLWFDGFTWGFKKVPEIQFGFRLMRKIGLFGLIGLLAQDVIRSTSYILIQSKVTLPAV